MPTSPLRIGPRIQETTTTTGIGPLTLDGATADHFPFSAVQSVPVAITVPYLIAWTGGMEWGYGEISSDGTTLTRVIVAGSYPGVWRNPGPGGQVNLPAGQKTVSLVVLDTQSLVSTGWGYAIDDPTEREQRFDELVALAYERGKGLSTATYFEIDDVIDPADSRRWITSALLSSPPPAPREGKKRPCIDTW